ncbi:RCC1 domain-containing protein [Nannocystis punicea]|uniref:DUF4215 domain-containing protein n=1 Tax=Nannocystis punicea TaxID=2995304 RepID=A0ABY7HC90_9BACT|nr:DUF4215 domain-containing protein [Nannocystis poenicansa]WAS96609.1 DUF4215 domain-containing protein [Nannocystis poenicansa]
MFSGTHSLVVALIAFYPVLHAFDCDAPPPHAVCGDGVVESTEQCDDGNAVNADRCSNECKAQEVEAVVTGLVHTCALLSGGAVKCWGGGPLLGLGTTDNRGDEPGEMGAALPTVDLGAGNRSAALATAGTATCSLLTDRTLRCWGFDESGTLGRGSFDFTIGDEPGEMGAALPPVDLGKKTLVSAVGAGQLHFCALSTSGAVKCWGRNLEGQLGLGDTESRGDQPKEMGKKLPFVDLGSEAEVVELAVGGNHVCARLDTGAVKCWGDNQSGQLGLGDTENRGDQPGEMGEDLPPVDLGENQAVTQLAAGGFHTCALFANGRIKCWGFNEHGQLGLGDTLERGTMSGQMGDDLPFVDLGDGRTVVELGAGWFHTCAVLDDGSLKCWGRNVVGHLGLGDTEDRGDDPDEMGDDLPAVALGSGRTAVAVDSGFSHTCAVLDDASLKCWGFNSDGMLGLGDTDARGDERGEMGDNLPTVKLFSADW